MAAPKLSHKKDGVFSKTISEKKPPEVFFQDNLRKKTPEVCNESIIETLNWCLHHSATDLIFQTKRLKSYSGKRPQTVWGVRSQCTKYKQEQLWNSNRSGQTLAQLQQQDLLYRSIFRGAHKIFIQNFLWASQKNLQTSTSTEHLQDLNARTSWGGFQQDLHKICSQGPAQDNARTS